MTELVLSSSSLQSYLECHLQWWMGYIAMIPPRKSEQLEVGIATHSVAEWLLNAKEMEVKADLDYVQPPDIPPTGHVHDVAIELGYLYVRDVLPNIKPLLIEQSYQFELGGVLFQSILDVAEEDGTVRDLKTTGRRPAKDSDRYKISMIGHAIGFETLTGKLATNMVLDYLVRTKTPYYWPVELGPLTEDDVDLFEATLVGVSKSIAAGDFEPTGLSSPWACNMCQYSAHCGPYQRYKEVHDAQDTK